MNRYHGQVPELPDITVYCEAIAARLVGVPLTRIRIANPFLLRTVTPAPVELHGRTVIAVRRLGKRVVILLDGSFFVAIHLMIAGRLHWKPPATAIPKKFGLAAFDVPAGTLLLTEAGNTRRAALHLGEGEAALAALDRGGIEPLECDPPAFAAALTRENRTLKRALTDPRFVSGIGNAYSDEILHRARLSPFSLTRSLGADETARLIEATRAVLTEWTDRLRAECGAGFPEHVTAFRPDFAVHGRYGKPCPVCGTPVQRILYAANEANYCARCQTGGRLLADRALSRLLGSDWPRTLEELELRHG